MKAVQRKIKEGEIKRELLQIMKEEHVPYRKLAESLGVSFQCVYQALNKKKKIRVGTVDRFLSALGYELEIKGDGLDLSREKMPKLKNAPFDEIVGIAEATGFEVYIKKQEEQR